MTQHVSCTAHSVVSHRGLLTAGAAATALRGSSLLLGNAPSRYHNLGADFVNVAGGQSSRSANATI